MTKQNKNKKGRLAKSTLSVVLAASMVMTSSSFVWASPNVVEEVNPEPVVISEYVEEIAGETQEATPTAWGTDLTANLPTGQTADSCTFTWSVKGGAQIKTGSGTDNQKLAADDLEKEYVGKTITCVAHITTDDEDTAKDVTTAFSIIGKTLAAENIVVTSKEYPYTGKTQNPTDLEIKYKDVAASLGDTAFDENAYTLKKLETGNVNVGDGKIVILPGTGAIDNGAYIIPEAGIEIANAFTITAADLTGYSIDLGLQDKAYDGTAYTINKSLTVSKGDSSFELLGDDYDVTYEALKDSQLTDGAAVGVGAYKISSITVKNANFKSDSSKNVIQGENLKNNTFAIKANAEGTFTVDGEVGDKEFTGEATDFSDVTVKFGNIAVDPDDYTLNEVDKDWSIGQNKEVEIRSTGKNYESTITGKFTYNIVARDLKEHEVYLDEQNTENFGETPSYKYNNGNAVEPEVVIKSAPGAVKGIDYTVTYSNNKEVTKKDETATATVNFSNGLAGNEPLTLEFKIKALEDGDITDVDVVAPKNQRYTYDGTAKTPEITSVTCKVNGTQKILTKGTDYKVVIDAKNEVSDKGIEAVNAGTYTAKIVGIGNYTAADFTAKTVDFVVAPAAFSNDTVDVAEAVFSYSGSPIKPTFSVTHKGTKAAVSADEYSVYYLDDNNQLTSSFPSDMDDYKAVLIYKGSNYVNGDRLTVDYKIGTATLENAVVTLTNSTFAYDPSVIGQVPEVSSVYVGGVKLSEADANGKNGSYKVTYPEKKDCKNVGTYTIRIDGLNSYGKQTKEVTFEILPVEISKLDDFTVTAGTAHDGSVAAPYAKIEHNKYALVPGTDYDITNDTVNKMVTITGKGNYKTSTPISKKYDVASGMMLADPSIQVEVKGTYNYDGTQKRPSVDDIVLTEVYAGGSFTLRKGTDYSATVKEYGDNRNAGKGTITLTGTGSYKGDRVVEFDIVGIDIATGHQIVTTDLDKLNITYDKKDHATEIKSKVSVRNTATGRILAADGNYTVKLLQGGKEVTKAINPGIYTVSVEGTGNYSGSLSYDIKIAGIDLDSVAVIPTKLDDQVYTGKEVTPEVAVTAKNTTLKLEKDKDYTVSYLNNTEIGTAYAVVSGAGIYGGTYLVPFSITGMDISAATVTVDGTYSYTGKEIVPTVIVKVGDTVVAPADYDVVATDNINAGEAKFTVIGKNGCTGATAEAAFTIAKADQKLAVSKTIADALKVRNTNANTYTLKVTGADTELTYKSSNTKIAAVNSAGKISFKHVCGKATITVTAAADDNHNAATLKVAVTVKPATPKITITARAKGFNAKATAVKDITGYQVGYSTDKNFAASKTTKKLVGTTKALNKNFSGLSAKKGYYVRVRAYKKVGTTVYWGNWTSAKKITTK